MEMGLSPSYFQAYILLIFSILIVKSCAKDLRQVHLGYFV